jgi:hypothetical protein
MAELASQKLQMRLTPAEGEPDAALLDDVIRLVKQAVATPPATVSAAATGEFYPPTDEERKSLTGLESKIKHRIEQASAESRALVTQRAELLQQPDGEQKAREAALIAAQQVVSAVHRAMLRGVVVNTPEPTS